MALKKKFDVSKIEIPKKLTLRPYQQKIIDEIKEKLANGERAIFVQSSPGSGKTLMMSELVKEYSQNNNVLSVAHRQEIIKQTIGRYIAQGSNFNNTDVAMIQTATRHLDDIDKPKLIIVDEAHHAMANSYLNVLNKYNDDNTIKIYFSATPWRADGKGFTSLVPENNLIKGPTTKWLIDNGYLAPFTYYQPKLINDNLLKLSGRSGDFTNKSVQSAAKSIDPKKLVDWYEKLGDNQQGIVYAATIDSSKEIVDEFNRRGISAYHLDGATDTEERNQKIEEYKQGKIKILSNVEIFTEGLDLPAARVALIARPTMSLALYLQFAMRVLRPQEGKKAVMLDFAGNASRLGLPDHDYQWSLRAHDIKNKYVDGVTECKFCKRTFNKSELIVEFTKKDGEPILRVTCPYCSKVISEENLDADDVEGGEALDKAAEEYIKDDVAEVKNKEAFELYWLSNKELDTAMSLDFNFRVLLAKNEVRKIIPSKSENAYENILKDTVHYFYDHFLNVKFTFEEKDKAMKIFNEKLEKDNVDKEHIFDIDYLDKISMNIKKEMEYKKFLITPITFENPIDLNIKVADVQAECWNTDYYKVLFDSLLSDSKMSYISMEFPKELKERDNYKVAEDYFDKTRKEAANSIYQQKQYKLVKADPVTYQTGNKGIALRFIQSNSAVKAPRTRNYNLVAHRYDHTKLTSYASKDISTILVGNSYTKSDLKENDKYDFRTLAQKINTHVGEDFLIIPHNGSEKLMKLSKIKK